ncbi:MAG: site-2 protease family protein [Chloroflexi bacterium]|nr:site-2 protease family protein [Chloroflexota bacterium]
MLFAGLGFDIVYILLALLFVLTIHEASHALVATALGDPTPKSMGRLSLNPFAHLETTGVLMILLLGLGWGKPVRIDAEKLKFGPKIGMALVAIAGPISNLLLALVFSVPLRLKLLPLYSNIRVPLDALPFDLQPFYVGIGPLVLWIEWLSLALAVFNLIPLAPLDGSRLWQILLPTRVYFLVARVEIFGIFLVLGLILMDRFFGTNILAQILYPPIGGLWRLFVGTTPPFQF